MCSHCKHCYNLHYSLLSENCSDSFYLYDCRNCQDCILSSQLRNKQYTVLNQQYSREEYEKIKTGFLQTLSNNKNDIDGKFKKMLSEALHKNLNMINSQNCLGNFINDSKNIINGFYILNSEDCVNIYDSYNLKNCYDNSYNEQSELCVEIDTSYELYNCKFCTYTITLRDCSYCDQCDHLNNCFGCIGLKKQSHMILNKKYSAKDYEEMMQKIKKHMQNTGEYGKPFPSALTPFPYNITLAHTYYPLTKEEALSNGYMWNEEEHDIKQNATDSDPSALTCERSGKKYKIIPQELKFYQNSGLPMPKISPNERYKQLLEFQPPKKLRNAQCSVCTKSIPTVYPSETGYQIACEECYMKKVY